MKVKPDYELTVDRAIFKLAQKQLKAQLGIGVQVRHEGNNTILRYFSFIFGGQFWLEFGGSTILHFRANATSGNYSRRSSFRKTFPDVANPAFKPDDVVAAVLEISRYLQDVGQLFDKET